MNWVVLAVLAVVVFLVPTALVATFATNRDTHQYKEHYGPLGYTQELQSASKSKSTSQQQDAEEEPPVVDWPQEL